MRSWTIRLWLIISIIESQSEESSRQKFLTTFKLKEFPASFNFKTSKLIFKFTFTVELGKYFHFRKSLNGNKIIHLLDFIVCPPSVFPWLILGRNFHKIRFNILSQNWSFEGEILQIAAGRKCSNFIFVFFTDIDCWCCWCAGGNNPEQRCYESEKWRHVSPSQHLNTWTNTKIVLKHGNVIQILLHTPGMNSGHEPELHLIDQLLEAAIKSKVTAKRSIKLFLKVIVVWWKAVLNKNKL